MRTQTQENCILCLKVVDIACFEYYYNNVFASTSMTLLYICFCRELNAESFEKNFSPKIYKLTEILRKHRDRHLFCRTR